MKTKEQQLEAKESKMKREIDYYWSQQSYGELNTISEWDIERAEEELFGGEGKGAVGIDFNRYSDIKVQRAGNGSEGVASLQHFKDLSSLLPAQTHDDYHFLFRNIRKLGWSQPTPVQMNAIPFAVMGRDVMCCAQTGSGKTGAFLIPVFCQMEPGEAIGAQTDPFNGACDPGCLVLAPTRELCSQIYSDMRAFAWNSTFRVAQVYGGVDAKDQLWELARGIDLMVATPGRLIDFIDRKVLTVEFVKYLILDEADRMLDMGFEPQVRRIVNERGMTTIRQTLMFSATFPQDVQKLARDFMRDYIWIAVGMVGGACDSITQELVITDRRDKIDDVTSRLAETTGMTIIFCNSKLKCQELYDALQDTPGGVDTIHGDLNQAQREKALDGFRNGTSRVLTATDVASRGLDIPNVAHVICFDLPNSVDDYVHRIGRTGRIGNRGHSLTYVTRSKWGGINESEDTLKAIANMMRVAKQPIAGWLNEFLTDGTLPEKEKTVWGGQDVRAGESGWTTHTRTEKWGGGGGGGWNDESGGGWSEKKQDSWGGGGGWKKDDNPWGGSPKKEQSAWGAQKKDDGWAQKKDDGWAE